MAKPTFTAKLLNPPFLDPGLIISFLFQRRVILFDLGDLHALSSRELLKVTQVFVTHTHMDHFIGWDTLLRVSLGRDKEIHVFGPAGFFDRMEGKLGAYTWNLVEEYTNNLRIKVTEVEESRCRTRVYACRDRFRRPQREELAPFTGTLLRESGFRVEAALLDHRTPCLGFTLIEEFSINIDKEALKDLDLPVGPWLTSFKRAVRGKKIPEDVFTVAWTQDRKAMEKTFPFGELVQKIARISPGRKVTYLTDLVGSRENLERAEELARNADHLFVEAAFLDREREIARLKSHLTAKEAGTLARKAGARQLTVFHFSPRYSGMEEEIEEEAMAAFHDH